jgi:hypothetical protein
VRIITSCRVSSLPVLAETAGMQCTSLEQFATQVPGFAHVGRFLKPFSVSEMVLPNIEMDTGHFTAHPLHPPKTVLIEGDY